MSKAADAGDITLIQQGKLFHYGSQSTAIYHCPTTREW